MLDITVYNMVENNTNIVKIIEIICSILLAIFAFAQWNIQKRQKQISLFKIRIEHYNELRKLLNKFINFYPHKYSNGNVTLLLNTKEITKDDIAEYSELCCSFKILINSAKYIFSNNDIYTFEKKVFNFITKNQKFYTPEEESVWTDSCIDEYKIILDYIFDMDKLFETDLNITTKNKQYWNIVE